MHPFIHTYVHPSIHTYANTYIWQDPKRKTCKASWLETDQKLWGGEPPKIDMQYDTNYSFLLVVVIRFVLLQISTILLLLVLLLLPVQLVLVLLPWILSWQ